MNLTYIEQRRQMKLTGRSKPEETNGIPELMEKAQKVFNKWIRERDKNKGCICGCGRKVTDAGHFYPRTYTTVRFDEVNTNGQASICNLFGNKAISEEYRKGLIKKVGHGAVDQLTQRAQGTKRWERDELNAIIEKYSRKVKTKGE